MGLKWTDTLEIAMLLDDQHADVDPRYIRFTDLRTWILSLDEFDDLSEHCGERVLEAIQAAWISERE